MAFVINILNVMFCIVSIPILAIFLRFLTLVRLNNSVAFGYNFCGYRGYVNFIAFVQLLSCIMSAGLSICYLVEPYESFLIGPVITIQSIVVFGVFFPAIYVLFVVGSKGICVFDDFFIKVADMDRKTIKETQRKDYEYSQLL